MRFLSQLWNWLCQISWCWHRWKFSREERSHFVFICEKCYKTKKELHPKVRDCSHYWETLHRSVEVPDQKTSSDQICRKCGKSRTHVTPFWSSKK